MDIIQRKLTKTELDRAIEFYLDRPAPGSALFESWLSATELFFNKHGRPWGFLQICNEGQILSVSEKKKTYKRKKLPTRSRGGRKLCSKLQT